LNLPTRLLLFLGDRFLDRIFNENHDEYISVYEAAEVLEGGLKDKPKAIEPVLETILAQQKSFLETIKFSFFSVIPCGEDDKDRFLKSNFKIQEVELCPGTCTSPLLPALMVRPFHRALIVATVPVFGADFKYDHVSLLRYAMKPSPKRKVDIWEHVQDSDCYISR
jgi:hypothetical protein